jgi:hypothetical protein
MYDALDQHFVKAIEMRVRLIMLAKTKSALSY